VNPFRQRIRQSISDEALQIALITTPSAASRDASPPSPPCRLAGARQSAHTVRAEVIGHLDEYLAQFTAKVEENGIIGPPRTGCRRSCKNCFGHRRGTPWHTPAVRQIQIDGHGGDRTQSRLEAAGHPRGRDRPRRIHRATARRKNPPTSSRPPCICAATRWEQLFHEKLGIPYTEEIPILTDTAAKSCARSS